ncbi:MAG: hypothetical protein HY279_03760 [Nitrospinae bacterium]|nr:hypothetical protein [Nitrospinota bacterium]
MIGNYLNKRDVSLTLILLCFAFPCYAQEKTGITVRPHAGYGYSSSANSKYDGGVFHAGARFLLNSGERQRYGLEVSHFNLNGENDFTSFGIILEQLLWGWFNMSIGTVGYFSYGKDSDNPVGLTTNLGWEPEIFKNLTSFITYRNDIVFHNDTAVMTSVSAGLSWQF